METYNVKKGDTLGAIAQKYGVGLDDISGYSSGNVNLIYPNEKLTINKKVKLSELGNIPEATVDNSGAVDSPANYPAPAYSFSENDADTIKSDYNRTVNRSSELRKENDDLSQQLIDLYKQKSDSYADVYGMDKSDDIKLQLDKIMADRQNIENQSQLNAEGRGITDAGLEPQTTSQLRRNTIEANQKLAEYNYERGLTDNAIRDIDRVIDARYKPLEIEMDYKQQQYNDIYRTFSNQQSAYSNSLANIAKIRTSELEKDKETLAEEKRITTYKEKVMLNAKGNGAPASVIDAINRAKTSAEMVKASGRYGLSTTIYGKKYYTTKAKTSTKDSKCTNGKTWNGSRCVWIRQ